MERVELMVTVELVERPAFRVIGRRTWISGTDNSQFGSFWQQCGEDGLLHTLGSVGEQPGRQTGGMVIGVSCVEKDPSVRQFHFIVSVECPAGGSDLGVEEYTVPAAQWAVFRNRGGMPDALVEAEMFAFMQWLPQSGFQHAAAPEMEVYPAAQSGEEPPVEFWLPVKKTDESGHAAQ